MRKLIFLLILSPVFTGFAQEKISSLPVWNQTDDQTSTPDWLIHRIPIQAAVYRSADDKDIILANGLIRRSFRIQPNLACIDYTNLSTNVQLLRAVTAEARLTINGKVYNIGGVKGQKEKAYLLNDWIDHFTADKNDFNYKSYTVKAIEPHVKWKSTRWAANHQQATGQMLSFSFESDLPELSGIIVAIHYELYDGIPVICKWLSISNKSGKSIVINQVVNEILAAHEEESAVAGTTAQLKVPHGIYIESNYAFNNSMTARLSDQTTHWKKDSTYTSQVNYDLNAPCLLEVYPVTGPGIKLASGQVFKSIRTNELLLDSYDRERNGLAQRKMYNTLTPWTTENPIFMHLLESDPKKIKAIVDQCVATGYEGIILSFGSGINMEDTSEKNLKKYKAIADYAHYKGILIGGYSLFSSRKISDQDDVIDPKTLRPDVNALFGHAPCLGSNWGLNYIKNLKEFMTKTGFNLFENDGPYPGDLCASTQHPGHQGLADSQWTQMELQKGLYHWCSENGIYVNAPDWYFMDGSNKIALGYREVNFSLSREQQLILNRQNIYDGTWEKTPSMSWGFVPLSEYHGGGKEATLEPLSNHLNTYEQLMMQYYGAGVQACYRGPRLFDTEQTKKVVVSVLSWYKKYRSILNSDLIHLRRPDGRDWDGIMHVNPNIKEKALVMLYNSLNEPITRKIKLPLYYTGLNEMASIREKEGEAKTYTLDREWNVVYDVTIPANGYTWLVVE